MSVVLLQADARAIPLADKSVNCCVTSPPYWGLRDYGVAGQLGLERTPEEYIANMVQVFREVKRVLRDDGTLWLNIGDCYHNGDKGGYAKDQIKVEDSMQRSNLGANFIGAPNRQPHPLLKPKDLVGIPWMLAFALRADGWYLRSDIIWHKPNPMPESVTDRPTKAHEYIFLMTKSERYYYNQNAIREPFAEALNRNWDAREIAGLNGAGANKRSVWAIATRPFPEAHFATFPEELIKPCILGGCPAGGIVLDPFMGSGTTGLVARNLNCHAVGLELNPEYLKIARRRLRQEVLEFAS